MPQIGSIGQRRLLNSKVLIIGAGGLGSPVSIYLTLAGIGKIGIIDMDTVEISNLQRQILHSTDRVGQPKVISAVMTLSALNPDVKIETHKERLKYHKFLDNELASASKPVVCNHPDTITQLLDAWGESPKMTMSNVSPNLKSEMLATVVVFGMNTNTNLSLIHI